MKVRHAWAAAVLLLISSPGYAAQPFDGAWDTTLSCPDAHGALGYSFRFESVIANGTLHGE